MSKPAGAIDPLAAEVLGRFQAARAPITADGEWLLGFATGPVRSGADLARVTLVGALARRLAASIDASFRDAFEWLNSGGGNCNAFVRTGLPSTRGPIAYSDDHKPRTFDGVSFVPISVPLLPRVVPRWQYWRVHPFPRAPIASLFQDTPWVGQRENFLSFRDADGQRDVARWFDWTADLRERPMSNLPIPAGQQLQLRASEVLRLAAES